ncbi:MAG: hypothetical protein Q8Q17_00725 [bacterium]|nr:hypothetical protein [bacterium]
MGGASHRWLGALCFYNYDIQFSHSMKKIVLVFITIILFSVGSQIADATSGACSSHSGVNCSIGRQLNGKVYCNDGWTDSMVDYDFMVACENQKLGCSLEQMENLLLKYDLGGISDRMRDISDKMYANAMSKPIDIGLGRLFQIQYDTIKGLYDATYRGITTQCSALGEINRLDREEKLLQFQAAQLEKERLQAKTDGLKEDQQKADSEARIKYLEDLIKLQNTPQYNCQVNSTPNGTGCKCDSGYFVYNDYPNQCISPTGYCRLKYGDHILANETNCVCESGYVWDVSHACIKVVQPTTTGKFDNIFKQPESPAKTINPQKEVIPSVKAQAAISAVSKYLNGKPKEETAPLIKIQGLEKIVASGTTTTAPDNKIEERNDTPRKQGFFSKVFGSIGGFFSRFFR